MPGGPELAGISQVILRDGQRARREWEPFQLLPPITKAKTLPTPEGPIQETGDVTDYHPEPGGRRPTAGWQGRRP
jgi:hypothetical protein